MENLSNFLKNSSKSKLDYTTAVKNKKSICKILQIDENCTYQQFKNNIRYKFVGALPDIAKSKNVEAIKLAKNVLDLCNFNINNFSRWLSPEQITEIKKVIK